MVLSLAIGQVSYYHNKQRGGVFFFYKYIQPFFFLPFLFPLRSFERKINKSLFSFSSPYLRFFRDGRNERNNRNRLALKHEFKERLISGFIHIFTLYSNIYLFFYINPNWEYIPCRQNMFLYSMFEFKT